MIQVSYQQQTQDISRSSISTMSCDEDEQRTHSSAPTTANSSPYNNLVKQDQYDRANPFKNDNTSPDLLQTEFYNSENNPIDHVTNFRKSIVLSDSMDSTKFREIQENETSTFGMTNSPSLADLANILEKKTGKPNKESGLRNVVNQSMDTIVPIEEEEQEEEEQEQEQKPQPSPEKEYLIDVENIYQAPQYNFQTDSPNLIQFEDVDSVANSNESSNNNFVAEPVEPVQHDDIFKTPKIEEVQTFTKQNNYRSMLDDVLEDNETHVSVSSSVEVHEGSEPVPSIPEIINTPVLEQIQSPTKLALETAPNSPTFLQETPIFEQVPGHSFDHNSDIVSYRSTESLKPLPLPKKQEVASSKAQQRSASLPALSTSEVSKKEKRKSGFMSLFKSKKSSSLTNSVEPVKQNETTNKLPKETNKRSVSEQVQPTFKELKTIKSSKSFQIIPSKPSEPKVAKRSTSSTSLFSAFRRKNKMTNDLVDGFEIQTKPTSPHNIFKKQLTPRYHNDNDSDFDEFHEDFNKFKIESPVPFKLQSPVEVKPQPAVEENSENAVDIKFESSVIAQGETLFPKSLNPQEVESIVSLERNRSVISRHSINSNNPRRSLTDAISYNARESGMSVEIGRESSIPDLSKSPQSSVLKKKTSSGSISNYFYDDNFELDDEELFNVEEFSQSLEFDNIASYSASEYQDKEPEEEEELDDISKLVEFADFIDFGGDLELGFDEYEQDMANSPEKEQYPLSSPALNQKSLSIKQESIISQSPLTSPFLQQDSFIPENSTLARPISMSFSGLKGPAFENPSDHSPSDNFAFKSSPSTAPRQLLATATTITTSKGRKVAFSSKITLYDAFNEEEYDRHPEIATCNQLTPAIAQMIKNELNALKAEMPVHEDSRCYTHFF